MMDLSKTFGCIPNDLFLTNHTRTEKTLCSNKGYSLGQSFLTSLSMILFCESRIQIYITLLIITQLGLLRTPWKNYGFYLQFYDFKSRKISSDCNL